LLTKVYMCGSGTVISVTVFSTKNSSILQVYREEKNKFSLDGHGIKSRWGRDLPHRSILMLGFNQPLVKWVLNVFFGVKAGGMSLTTHPPSSAEVKEGVALSPTPPGQHK
jgi:hypothetical protein